MVRSVFDVGSNPDDAGQGAHPCAHGSFGVSSRVARSAVSSRVVWPSSSSAARQRSHGNVASDAGSLVTDADVVKQPSRADAGVGVADTDALQGPDVESRFGTLENPYCPRTFRTDRHEPAQPRSVCLAECGGVFDQLGDELHVYAQASTDAEQVRSFGHGENLRSRLTDPNMSTQEQARMRRFAAGVKG